MSAVELSFVWVPQFSRDVGCDSLEFARRAMRVCLVCSIRFLNTLNDCIASRGQQLS